MDLVKVAILGMINGFSAPGLTKGGVRTEGQREFTSVNTITILSSFDQVLVVLELPTACDAM